MDRSAPALTISPPSGLNATAFTLLAWPVSRRSGAEPARSPDPDGRVIACAGDEFPIRAERHRVRPRWAWQKVAKLLASFRVPDPDRPVGTCARNPVAAPVIHGRPHQPGMAGQLRALLARVGIPDSDRPVVSGARDYPAIRTVGDRPNRTGMTFELDPLLTGSDIPYPDRTVTAAGGDEQSARPERDGKHSASVAAERASTSASDSHSGSRPSGGHFPPSTP